MLQTEQREKEAVLAEVDAQADLQLAWLSPACWFPSGPCRICGLRATATVPSPFLPAAPAISRSSPRDKLSLDAQLNPVLLLPLGDRWLVESRAEFEGAFERPPGGGAYGGPVSKNLDYLQAGLHRQPVPYDHPGPVSDPLRHLQRAALSHLDPQLAAGPFHLSHRPPDRATA